MKKIVLLIILLSFGHNVFGKYLNINEDIKDVLSYFPRYQRIYRNDKSFVIVDMQKVLLLTAGVESHFSKYPYDGRIAKTYMQLEEETVKWVKKVNKPDLDFLERGLGRELDFRKDSDAMFVAYLLYATKLKYHKDRFFKQLVSHRNDLEWRVYKIYYNTYRGSAKYSLWESRQREVDLLYR